MNRLTHLSSLSLRVPHLAILALILLGAASLAADSRIELRDGSVLTGELVGVGEGGFRVRSPVLGELEIPESEVLAIRPADPGSATRTDSGSAAGRGYQSEISGLQEQMVGDPAIMASITALQTDPDLQAALADPDFARRVLAGDIESLRADPRFMRLLKHPAIQAIVGQLSGQ